MVDDCSSQVLMISLYYNVFLVQMTKPSPSKKAMKFKKQDLHPVFPPSLVPSNFDHIRETEIGHVDLVEFLKRIEKPPSNYKMEPTINSSIHLVSTFPMFAQDPKFVMATANHFDLVGKSVKDTSGKKIIKLDEDFFDTIFKCPNIEKYSNITIQSTQAYYDMNSAKCRKNINDNWLKTSRPQDLQFPGGQKPFLEVISYKRLMI